MQRFTWPIASAVVEDGEVKVVTFPAKAVSEVLPCTVNFSDMLQFGEAITGATCTATVYSGTDVNPQNIIDGNASFTNTTVTQNVTGGVAGNTYCIFVLVTATNSHNYAKIFYISVIADTGGI